MSRKGIGKFRIFLKETKSGGESGGLQAAQLLLRRFRIIPFEIRLV
jgi:hypothetical protein